MRIPPATSAVLLLLAGLFGLLAWLVGVGWALVVLAVIAPCFGPGVVHVWEMYRGRGEGTSASAVDAS